VPSIRRPQLNDRDALGVGAIREDRPGSRNDFLAGLCAGSSQAPRRTVGLNALKINRISRFACVVASV
jgi:hypothetical protein